MAIDAVSLFGLTTISVTPASPTSATAFLVADTAQWPTAPFDLVVHATGVFPSMANAEIIRVLTYNGGGVQTCTRATTGTTALSLAANYICYPSAYSVVKQTRDLVANAALAWTTYNGPLVVGSGTLTSAAFVGHYLFIGHMLNFAGVINITTNGTAATSLQFTLPLGALAASRTPFVAICDTTANLPLNGVIVSGTGLGLIYLQSSSGYPGVDGRQISVSGVVEVL